MSEENTGVSVNKKNYQDLNLDYLEKIKEKKLKEQEDKMMREKKEQEKRERLKKKILTDAIKNRENMDKAEEQDVQIESSKTVSRRKHNFESLPKIQQSDSKDVENEFKRDYRERHISFLKSLTEANKSKKEIEEVEKKKKEEKYSKLKEELGFGNIESKLSHNNVKPKTSESLMRSHSEEKLESLIDKIESEMPKTNKNFNKKNEEYLEKIKKRREQEKQAKEDENARKEKVETFLFELKDNLKNFVMVTVKKNVLDGVYDEEIEKIEKKKTKALKSKTQDKSAVDNEDSENDDEEESSSEEETVGKKRKMRSFPYITDLAEWKKKNRIEPSDKVYIVTGGYGELKKALKERGWYHNPDRNSPCFDFKYTLQGREIDYDHLQDGQLVNHFQKAGCLTTKVGLSKSLRGLKYIKDTSEDNFFPKCFDLNEEDDYIGFETHFKICKALSILKMYTSFVNEMHLSAEIKQKNKILIQDLKLRTEVALEVCKKNIEDIDEIIDKKKIVKIVTDKEWEILAQDELNEEGLAKKKHEEWLKSIDCKFNSQPAKEKVVKKKKTDVSKKDKKIENAGENSQEEEEEEEIENLLLIQVQEILSEYEKKYPQYHLTGHNNIWILKPAGLSRGRGITCYNNLVEIQDHVKCKESQWIAQKYIENPLVILKRKFDIRQWVLITDFNPLTVWLYDECYIRFSAEDYDAKNVHNKFIHLTNNSIGSYHKNFGSSHIKGNMFCQEEFSSYLKEKEGSDIFFEKIRPQIKEIVKNSMLCGVEHIENRKNTHELYGYDFMVDESYKVWLIEINSSPSMDYSTHVTSKLVKECLHDTVKVVVDYGSAPKKEKKGIDTGKWKRVYKGVEVPDKPITSGLNLCLEGVQMKKPKKGSGNGNGPGKGEK